MHLRFRRSEEHTSELQSLTKLVCRLLLEKNEPIDRVYPAMVQGTHEMLAAIRLPIAEGNRILGQISDGKIDERSALIFFNDTATTEIYTLSLHDALPIS